MENFNVTKIANYLKKFKNQLDNYGWSPPKYDRLLTIKTINKTELDALNSGKDYFQKDEKLKNILSKKLQESNSKDKKQFKEIASWIIHDWGRINGDPMNAINLVYDFFRTGRLTFERIASTSKVLGFMYPDRNIIYDSRVSYTLNWIILSQKAGSKFFPIPEGRNSKMKAFDLNVLIHLQYIDKYKPNELKEIMNNKNYISEKSRSLYISEEDAYDEMNKLICEVNKILWEDKRKNEPFYTEMLLFSLADTVVFKEITESVTIKINGK